MPEPRLDILADYASRPFRIVESMKLVCGYERSFKLMPGAILANRYLLGVDLPDSARSLCTTIRDRIGMPGALQPEFDAGVDSANLLFLGFEADQNNRPVMKLYLEYWDALHARRSPGAAAVEPGILHKGFKWRGDDPDKAVVSLYQWLPNLALDQIRDRILGQYGATGSGSCSAAVQQILATVMAARPDRPYTYVEVSEAGEVRNSFDLNLYPAGLRVGDVEQAIVDAADKMDIPERYTQRILDLSRAAPLGHLSAGTGRGGEEYLTIYYEQ